MGSISIFLLFSLPYTIPLSVSLPAFLGFCVCVCVLFFKEADTQTEMHMQQTNSTVLAVTSLSFGAPTFSHFLVFSLNVFFAVSPLCKAKGREQLWWFCFALLCFPFFILYLLFFFFSSSQLGVFGVFVSVGIDEHIPNKPVSSAYVRF